MSQHILQDDIVRATELNRSSGEVLNRASRAPLTIIRNDEQYALMRREVAGRWRREATASIHLAELVWNALAHPVQMGPEFAWLSAFDHEDRETLTRELMDLYQRAVSSGSWNEFDDRLHEWSESGWAALSPELNEAFESITDERIPLQEDPVELAG